MQQKVDIRNKKAAYEYQLLDTFTAGIILTGTEIKSLRTGAGSVNEAFCLMKGEEIFIKSMNIPVYELGTHNNHDPLRLRKLLLTGRELKKILSRVKEKGMTVVPIRLFLNERGLAKVEIALARGKKSFDKRDTIKQRDSKRELDRVKKQFKR
jgi:SsrA-binding protein